MQNVCTFVIIDRNWFFFSIRFLCVCVCLLLFSPWMMFCCSHYFPFPFLIDSFIDSKLKSSTAILDHPIRIGIMYSIHCTYISGFFSLLSLARHRLWMVGWNGLFFSSLPCITNEFKFGISCYSFRYNKTNLSLECKRVKMLWNGNQLKWTSAIHLSRISFFFLLLAFMANFFYPTTVASIPLE